MKRAALLLGGLLVLAGCTPSEEDLQKEFDAFVAGANSCAMPSECAAASAGCPLGCGVAVRADRKAAVEAKARELIDRYERYGARCEYDCVGHGPATCTEGRCAFEPLK
jgi:hypothetical protein